MQTAKRILKKASAEDEDPLGGLLNCRNSPFEDICTVADEFDENER